MLQSADDIVDLIGLCFEYRTRSVLLYAENLTDRFFDLSSGDAGAVLQKLRNYRIRLAIVLTPDRPQQSMMFREMAREEGRDNDFRLFDDRNAAEAWLIGRPQPDKTTGLGQA